VIDREKRPSGSEETTERPFPRSQCHRCAAPPRYVTTDRGATFIYCPVLKRYPPQPVQGCEAFAETPCGPTPDSD
jgi:hypothetical protein